MDFNIDNFTAGDLEDIESYAGPEAFGSIMAAFGDGDDEGGFDLSKLSAKTLTAFLGVAKRQDDPSWTPDRWREIKLAELADAQAAPPVPTTAAPTTSRSGKRGGNGGRGSGGSAST